MRAARALAPAALAALGGCLGWPVRAIVGPFPELGPDPPAGRPLEVARPDGVRLRGWVVSPAPPARGTVILLHGAGAGAAVWRRAAAALGAAGYRAVAWDARGHGRSGGLCTYGARERDDVRAVLDALAARGALRAPVVAVGHSMGAAVAIQAAAADPRIGAVLAAAPFATLDGVIRRVAWGAPRDALARVVAEAERRARFRVSEVRPIEAAARLRGPLLVVAATADARVPIAEARAIAGAAPRGRIAVVPGAGHDDLLARCGWRCDALLGELLREAENETGAPGGAPVSR